MRLIKIAFILLLVLALLLVLTPFAAKHYILARLNERNYQASVGDVGLNPLTGILSLTNLQIESQDGQRLRIYDASVPFKPLDLFSKKLTLDTAELENVYVDIRSTVRGFDIAGLPGDLFLPGSDNPWSWSARRLDLTNVSICIPEQKHCIQVDNAVLNNARLYEENGSGMLKVDQGVSLNKLFYRDQASGAAILFVNNARSSFLSVSASGLITRNLKVANLQLVETPAPEGTVAEVPYQTQIGSLSLDEFDMSVDKKSLSLGRVDANSWRQAYHRTEQGESVLLKSLIASFPDQSAVIQSGLQLYSLRMQSLKLTGAEWLLDDRSVAPPAKQAFKSISLNLGEVDSQKPELAAPLEVSAKTGEAGSLSLEGLWQPFQPSTQFEGQARVGNFALEGMSAYVSRMLGQKFNKGTVDATFNGKVVGGAVDIASIWRLTGFSLVPGTSVRGSGMSLHRSIALLEDTNNSVRVEVALKGDLHDEPATLQGLVGLPMRRALSRQVGQQGGGGNARPVAALSAMKPGQMTISSLVYDTNVVQPRDHEIKRLAQLSERLKEKPNLLMTFCPVSTGGEWSEIYNGGRAPKSRTAPMTNAQRTALINLAEKRSAWVKVHLNKLGVSATQIGPCGPSLDPTESGPSYISVSL